ncbi:MAG TPA: helix-turn-helix domain-containing protein [Lacunisphaera sp.]|nr:helix-turn-helix domain-containing protein [Lacunisphaera sp.]
MESNAGSAPNGQVSTAKEGQIMTVREVVNNHVRNVVATIGNKSLAAKVLGVDRRTLYRLLARGDGKKTRLGRAP